MKKTAGLFMLLVLCAMLVFSGCSDSDSHGTVTISGTASTGAPVVGTITVKDAEGSEAGPVAIEADGSFTIDVSGYTAPFVIKATVTATADELYSYALAAEQTNVNPLTTLIVAAAAGVNDPGAVYDDTTGISEADISTALSDVQTLLAHLFTAFGVDTAFDPLSGDCTVNHVGIDALFDAVTITINTGTGAVVIASLDSTVLATTSTTTVNTATAVTPAAASGAASQVPWVGTYNYCELFLDTPSGGNGATAAAGHITFDADGTWSSEVEASSTSADVGETDSGTYTIDATGRIWINGSQYGAITPDGEIAVVPDVDATEGLDVGLTILCKRDTTLTNADISGTYAIIDLYRDIPSHGSGADAGVSFITFNGDGTYGAAAGTYSVDADGRFTANGTEDYGTVAKGGEVIVLPDYDPVEGDDVGITVMVRTSTAAGWDVAAIDGDYNFAEMFAGVTVTADSPEDAVNTAGGVLSFDGAGSLSLTLAYSSEGETDDFDGSYIAETSYEGTTLNCMNAGGSYGFFTLDGYLLVVPDNDATEGQDVGMTLGVQAW